MAGTDRAGRDRSHKCPRHCLHSTSAPVQVTLLQRACACAADTPGRFLVAWLRVSEWKSNSGLTGTELQMEKGGPSV